MWLWSDLKVFSILILIIFITLYIYLKYRYKYWLRYSIPQIPPTLFVGNLGPLLQMSKSSAHVIQDFYHYHKAKDNAVVGFYLFHTPALLIRDPELIKRVLIRDFNKFADRYCRSDVLRDPLGSQNLFLLKNPAWKEIRFKLTPFFTSNKLKQMFPLVEEVAQNLNNYLLKLPLTNDDNSFDLELKEFCALYTTDVIATVAFGVEANSFKSPNGDFRKNGREIFRFNARRALNFTIIFFLPHLVSYLGIKILADEQTKFLRSTMNYVLQEREKSGKTRNDLIDILIEFKNATKSHKADKKGDLKFEGDLLVAQAAIFFTAGFESSSATMSFALYELARNPQVQEILRQEIKEALKEHQGKITQQLVDSMEYLQMIISETLRLYPPLPFLDRECTGEKDQLYSLEPFQQYSLPKGMPVYIPVYALHMDEKYFPQPLEFKPERFSAENRKSITPYTYMPFGLGPRACIGERFAYLQTKIGLIEFLRNHRVALNENTLPQLKLDPKALILQSQGGIHLKVIRDPLML